MGFIFTYSINTIANLSKNSLFFNNKNSKKQKKKQILKFLYKKRKERISRSFLLTLAKLVTGS